MPAEPYNTIHALLASSEPEQMRRGLDLLKQEFAGADPVRAATLFELVSALFYIDPLDRPDLVPILDEAVSFAVGLGPWVIPLLVAQLDAGDMKAQLAIGHALGRIGAEAVEPLIEVYNSSADVNRRCFVLYALGKIRSPEVLKAVSLALDAAGSADLELRDTATRALGRFAEAIPGGRVPEDLRCRVVDTLRANLADTNPVIRAKSIRSLGKLARFGHLAASEREVLKPVCHGLIGNDEAFEWDRAYIVRKEADEALRYL